MYSHYQKVHCSSVVVCRMHAVISTFYRNTGTMKLVFVEQSKQASMLAQQEQLLIAHSRTLLSGPLVAF